MITTGTSLLHYRFTERLGEGVMGAAWKAIDATLDGDIAIKVLPFSQAMPRGWRGLSARRSPDRRTIYCGA